MTILDESRLSRLGIRVGWGLGENLYRGQDQYSKGLLNTLRILSNYQRYGVTDFALTDTLRHFPPNSNINEWVENDYQYPHPEAEIRRVVGGKVYVISPTGEPAVPFPTNPPADPNDPDDPNQPDPDVFTTGYDENKWLYDPVEWKVIGRILFGTPAPVGMIVFSRVDNAWAVWNGSDWVVAARAFERSLEITANYPRPFVGGRLFTYCAVESFRIPAGMRGSTGIAKVNGQVSLQVLRNADVIGSVNFYPTGDWRASFSSAADVQFDPGDRLSVYTEDATKGMNQIALTIRGIYN